jgi:hypothetical protein
MGSAVRGRESRVLGSCNRPGLSFEGGEVVVPADMIDDIEFESEWPGLTVELESLDTKDNGRGII